MKMFLGVVVVVMLNGNLLEVEEMRWCCQTHKIELSLFGNKDENGHNKFMSSWFGIVSKVDQSVVSLRNNLLWFIFIAALISNILRNTHNDVKTFLKYGLRVDANEIGFICIIWR